MGDNELKEHTRRLAVAAKLLAFKSVYSELAMLLTDAEFLDFNTGLIGAIAEDTRNVINGLRTESK